MPYDKENSTKKTSKVTMKSVSGCLVHRYSMPQ